MTNVLLGIIAVLLWAILGQLNGIKLLMVLRSGKQEAGVIKNIMFENSVKLYAFGALAIMIVVGYAVWAYYQA